MILTMALAGFTGAFIPLFLKRINLDPAQSSSIFLTPQLIWRGFYLPTTGKSSYSVRKFSVTSRAVFPEGS